MILKDNLYVIKNNPTIYILSIENEILYKDLIENGVDMSEVYNVLPYLGTNLTEIQSTDYYETAIIYHAKVKQVLVLHNTMYIFIGLSHSELNKIIQESGQI